MSNSFVFQGAITLTTEAAFGIVFPVHRRHLCEVFYEWALLKKKKEKKESKMGKQKVSKKKNKNIFLDYGFKTETKSSPLPPTEMWQIERGERGQEQMSWEVLGSFSFCKETLSAL